VISLRGPLDFSVAPNCIPLKLPSVEDRNGSNSDKPVGGRYLLLLRTAAEMLRHSVLRMMISTSSRRRRQHFP
jgi:hypothetical protein